MKEFEKTEWKAKIQALGTVLEHLPQDQVWTSLEKTAPSLETIYEHFDQDIQTLEQEALFICSPQIDTEHAAPQMADLIGRWKVTGTSASLTAICVFTLEKLDVHPSPDIVQAILMAGMLGEVENNLPYHNNMHYRKVLLNLICMIAEHNHIYEGTNRALTADQIGTMLIAACIHDFGHDGLGNTVKGVFQQGRLERRSFELVKPCLEVAGVTEEEILQDIKVMLLCTDVNPLGDLGNPLNQMKAAYRFHYMGDKTRMHTLNLDEEIAVLELDPHLTNMCLIMHEADIATSAGLTYEITKYETTILMAEIGTKIARPEHVIDFLNQICQRKFLSDAGQRLYAANLARIYALAEADLEVGNEAYPEAQYSDFLLAHKRGETSKSVN